MARHPRPLSEHDRAAWAAYVRHVQALTGREVPQPPSAPAQPMGKITPKATPPAQPPAPAAKPIARPVTLVTGAQPAGLDNATWGKFRGGKLPAARTLDLHGKTAQAAFHALQNFLLDAHAEQLRCVEIITGRGTGEHGGVIRRELPLWLNLPALRPLVLATAHPHARNTGSTRVLLRRAR
jgi:DNA-nicking Smr family endonuclease